MPNWCSNILSIHGSSNEVKRFLDRNSHVVSQDDGNTYKIPLSFSVALPTPDQGKFDGMENREVLGHPEYWYNWNVSNWGTKWDLDEDTHLDVIENDDNTSTAVLKFETAWSPPEMWLHYVASMYPDLSFRLEFFEEGMGFAGSIGYHNGRIVENNEFDSVGMVERYKDIYE